jgi:UDP-glucuronate 4-epimerase
MRDGVVIVTGAAGFIGSHLVERLLTMGHAVVGVDNFDPFYAPALKRANINDALAAADARAPGSAARFTLHEFDLADARATDALVRHVAATAPIAAIFHLAAKAGVRPSIADPVAYASANVVATAAVLDAANRIPTHGSERFPVVVASSSSVYGNAPTAPFREDHDVSQPISPYAATKRACELIGHTHWHLTRQPVAMLRFFTVYGPRQRPDLAIAAFLRKVATRQPITVFGDGSMTRDFTFVSDTVDGILASARAVPAHGFRIWNLGHDHPVRLDAMVRAVERAVGVDAIIDRLPDQPGDVRQTWADLTRSRSELGYAPRVGFEDGVLAQWEWLKPRL